MEKFGSKIHLPCQGNGGGEERGERQKKESIMRGHFPLWYTDDIAASEMLSSCLENPMDRGTWWAAVHRVVQSRTQLQRLASIFGESYCTNSLIS